MRPIAFALFAVPFLSGSLAAQDSCSGEPWQRSFSVSIAPGRYDVLRSVFEVPEGKLLVLEQASFLARGNGSSGRPLAVLRTGEDENAVTLRYPLEYQGSTFLESLALASPRLRLYVPSGQKLYVGLFRFDSFGTTAMDATLVGCLRQ